VSDERLRRRWTIRLSPNQSVGHLRFAERQTQAEVAMMDASTGKKIVQLRERILGNFKAGDWEAIGLLTGLSDVIDNHPRLLRSLSWGDEDYAGNVLTVLKTVIEKDTKALQLSRIILANTIQATTSTSPQSLPSARSYFPQVFSRRQTAGLSLTLWP
jgi:AbiJ N-terminal domain 5